MTKDPEFDLELSRRKLLAAAGIGVAAVVAASVIGTGGAEAASSEAPAADPVNTPPIAGLHLQFGADASSEMVVSWHTLQPVKNPRVVLGQLDGKFEQTVEATPASYTDAKHGRVVYAYHAKLGGLQADHAYLYGAMHDGTEPEFATFRTAPRGRAPLSFTSFGDQGTPTLGKKFVPPEGVTIANPPFVNDNLGSPAAGDTTLAVERLKPLFHLFNGDLCYANLAEDRVRTWWDFWDNNSRSARKRPWMPSAGNHENELGNGPIGYQAYQTYFSVPDAAGQTEVTRGLWYAFTAGSMRVISIANDDVCYQDGGNSYVRGYSQGAQKAWLEKELAAARDNHDIDWVVVCMHQVAISTADMFNGADLGIREEWVPLFDRYGVDLVVCGHEHHYERSHPIRGRESNATLTPLPAATTTDVIDTTKGTVHMVIGGGGTSIPSNELFFDPPACRVIVSVG
ncbi:MAG: metallophosphoesterase family protein, partial [Bradyrhizobium sp.]|nr:metallophosphoesterase family protein [Bradyrhizobium sp.]